MRPRDCSNVVIWSKNERGMKCNVYEIKLLLDNHPTQYNYTVPLLVMRRFSPPTLESVGHNIRVLFTEMYQ